jgi:DNA-binding NarL/FixJ family response regulator
MVSRKNDPQRSVFVHTKHPLVFRTISTLLAAARCSVRHYSELRIRGCEERGRVIIVDACSVENWLEVAVHCGVKGCRTIIILPESLQADEQEQLRLVYLGVRGIVLIPNLETALSPAVDSVMQGQLWLPRKILDEYVVRTNSPGVVGGLGFTPREEQIITFLMRGMSNKIIGAMLDISERTVKFHVSNVLRKFQVRSRRELLKAKQPSKFNTGAEVISQLVGSRSTLTVDSGNSITHIPELPARPAAAGRIFSKLR